MMNNEMVLRGESMDSPRDEKEIDAKDLISINRLDIIAKYKYVEDRLKNLNCKFFKTLYLKVIEAHTRGTFTSTEHQDKNSKEKFLQYFDNTIDSIVNNGFDYNISKLIIDKNGVIVNGGHRVAILAYLNQKVLLHYQENDIEVKDDTEDYRKRLLEDKYIDYLVSEYFRLTLKSKIIMSTKELDIENIFNVKLIYTKIIKFTDTGIENIQKITGIQNNIKKFRGTKKIYIYIIENNDIENDIEGQLKRNESILYYFSKKEEVSNMIYMLLNENTISFINYSKLNEDIRLYLTQIKEELIKRHLDLEDVVICKDVTEKLSKQELHNIIRTLPEIQEERKKVSEYIYNPDDYMYLEDVKFDITKKKKKYKKYILGKHCKQIAHEVRIFIRNTYVKTRKRMKKIIKGK